MATRPSNATATPEPQKSVVTLFPIDKALRKPAFRVALIGTFAPRKCGIATFTTDIRDQLAIHHPEVAVDIYALDNVAEPLAYPEAAGVIGASNLEDYGWAARQINHSGADAVWIQHEFGIFGGDEGEYVCHLADRVAAPVILTAHTVLSEPSPTQERILRHLITRSSAIMAMSKHAKDLLVRVYDANPDTVTVIPHGAPDRPFGREDSFKERFGHAGRPVIMSFGLLGRGKGLECVIEALPAVLEKHPDAIYRIVGATHPNLVASDGEKYREELQACASRLGVEHAIEWDNRFLDTPELLDQLEGCDIFITAYPNLQQATSGTLSYAVALGKAVISTPYSHARELLSDDGGVLVPPGSSAAIADAINDLFDDPEKLLSIKRRAYARGRTTIWPEFAAACATLVNGVVPPEAPEVPTTARPSLFGVFAMSDSTGMLQHSVGIVPDRDHGYCLDDNARALMLMNVAEALGQPERQAWSMTYASFIQHAWNDDVRRFRNFMNFDRSWCEAIGSEDSNGRALWALGHTVENSPDQSLRDWARAHFELFLPHLAAMPALRATCFAMLGAAAVLRSSGPMPEAAALLESGGERLAATLDAARRPGWCWFESALGYDNPRVPQALIEAGVLCDRNDWVEAGCEALEWICDQQRGTRGQFRPVGSETFGHLFTSLPFDQQPLEAWAAIDAARSAYAAKAGREWLDYAIAAWRWYFGDNDRGVPLADMRSGRCQDGLTPRGANVNCGAESILAFHLAHYAMLELRRMVSPGISMGLDIGTDISHSASHP
jgi:glycosyltransferase involved in cell wall biosynthesis